MQPKEEITRRDLRGAIIGMVLGDGSLYRNKFRDGQYGGNYKLDVAHSLRQLPYLEYKRDIVNRMFDYQIPITYRFVSSGNWKQYPVVKFATRTHSRLSFIGDRLYVDGKKRITDYALDNLTDEGMAYWWMDDGCLSINKAPRSGGQVIHGTYGFPKDDVCKLRDWIASRYGCVLNLVEHCKGGWCLRRGISEGMKMLEVLRPYSVPVMSYKFDYERGFLRGPYSLATVTVPSTPLG
jgi:LAGLIDADG DNA endonuclease family